MTAPPRVDKAYAYIVQVRNGIPSLLVFRSLDLPGTWEVVKGGIEEGETPEAAVIRECWEEAGLRDLTIVRKLGRVVYVGPSGTAMDGALEHQERHFFHLTPPPDAHLPPVWDHVVSGGGADELGQVFSFAWIPLISHDVSLLAPGFDAFIHLLRVTGV